MSGAATRRGNLPRTPFPFPGGKSRLAKWILEYVPEHECFVEVFGGAAGVLFNKDPATSSVEVYNDADEDLVHFFKVLREDVEELVAWLDAVPYSRKVHDRWADLYYKGYRPTDDIERAGRFFYLRYSQWGASYDSNSGFATSKVSSRALSFSNKIDRLEEFAERFQEVVLENLHWKRAVDKYDGEQTAFYFDPPYVDKQDYYPVEDIDHGELLERLEALTGYGLCSYQDLPEGGDEFHVMGREDTNMINSGKSGSGVDTREHLLLNFDPEVVL
ncbi:MAG: DNA adenine methylase [Halobacteriaceae archaeon]